MSHDQSQLSVEAQRHVESLFPPPFKVMERIEREVSAAGHPAIGRSTGAILRSLVAASRASRILEVGTNVGYSAMWLASELALRGHVDTIEIDAKLAREARENLREAGLQAKVVVHEGAALDVLARLQEPYDLVFLDAVKAELPRYLDHALRLSRSGTIIAADNAFWHGLAWARVDEEDVDSWGVQEYTRRVTSDPRLATSLVPSEDGLLVSVVR